MHSPALRARPRSTRTDPAFFRTYRVDEATDLLRSAPTGIDRLKHFHLLVSEPELKSMFDGSEEVISVATIPCCCLEHSVAYGSV